MVEDILKNEGTTKVNPSFNLSGKFVVVTGASRGIGQALAVGMARAGADVALIGRDDGALADTEKQIHALGQAAHRFVCDLRDTGAVRKTVEDIELHQPIDVLINNAGLNIRIPALQVTEDQWQTILDTDLRGAFFMAQQVGQSMVARQRGSIINVSSVGGHVALRTGVAYAAAKA